MELPAVRMTQPIAIDQPTMPSAHLLQEQFSSVSCLVNITNMQSPAWTLLVFVKKNIKY